MEFHYDPDRKESFSYDIEMTPVYCDPNTGELIPMPNGFPSTDEEAEMTLPRPSARLDQYYALRRQGAPIREALMEAWILGIEPNYASH